MTEENENPNKDLYKCHDCKLIIKKEDLVDGKCPECHSDTHLKQMCPNDKIYCSHEITGTIAYCNICGAPCCPICGAEDVTQVSRVRSVLVKAIRRVSGYLADVAGWNQGKAQELKDRTRYNPITGNQVKR